MDPKLIPNTSAGRLYRLVIESRRISSDLRNKSPGLATWALLLRYPVEDRPRLLKAVGEVCSLPDRVSKDMRAIEGIPHSTFLSWVDPVQAVFRSSNFDQPIEVYFKPFGTPEVSLLELCARELSMHTTEPSLEIDKVESLANEATKLFQELSKQSDPVSIYCAKHLDLIVQALRDVYVHGASSIPAAVTSSIALAVQQQYRTEQTDYEASPIWARVKQMLGTMVLLCDAVYYGYQLAAWTRPLLQGGEAGPANLP